jgi:uncharacterized membrane protein
MMRALEGIIRLFGIVGALVFAFFVSILLIGAGIYEHEWAYAIAGAIFGYIFFLSDWGWRRRRG